MALDSIVLQEQLRREAKRRADSRADEVEFLAKTHSISKTPSLSQLGPQPSTPQQGPRRYSLDESLRLGTSGRLAGAMVSLARTKSLLSESGEENLHHFYCVDCGTLCTLDDLIMDGAHKTHEYVYALEQAIITADEIALMAGPAQQARQSYDGKVAQLRRRIGEVEQLCDKQAQLIDSRFVALARRIERRRDALHRELAQTRDRKLAPLRDLLQRMTVLSDKADSALAQLQEAKKELSVLPQGPASPYYSSRQVDVEGSKDFGDGLEGELISPRNLDDSGSPLPATTGQDSGTHEGNSRAESLSGIATSKQKRKQVMAKRKEREKQREDRKRKGKRQAPVQLSQLLLNFVRQRPQLLNALQSMSTCAFSIPDADVIEVVFNARMESELDLFGRVAVTQAGFRPTSRANFGGTELRPGAEQRGVVWWLGTKGGAEVFRNPTELGLLQMPGTARFVKGSKRVLSAREPRDCYTESVHGSSVTFFLGRGRRLVPSYYSLTHGLSNSDFCLNTWVLEGATCSGGNDAPGTWFVVMSHVADDQLGKEAFNTVTWEIAPVCHKAFQYFRIRMIGPNTAADPRQQWVLCLAGFELFGTLYEDL
eukprot:Hpha_TRINITY_DN11782_c0_g1::TRINITY_DN11782_c0_g1_i1::g.31648::m.31648